MSRHWMPLYVADYLADTGHLTTLEHGAYMLLIMHYWQRGGLPDNDERLASIARASLEQWLSMRDTIAEFFGDGWSHGRIDDELQKAQEAYEKRASAGRKGGKAKAGNKQCSSNATTMLKQSSSQPSASEAKASSAARDDNEFDLIEGKLRRAAGVESDPSPGLLDLSPVMPFIDAGYSIDRDILPVIRAVAAKQKQKPRSWRYFLPALEEAFARRPEVPDKPKVAEKVFVEKGSDAWRAWCAHAGKTYPETEDRSQGIVRMGWHFPTEYPQAQETAA